MSRYSQVKGMPVITVEEGKKIGSIDDLLVDPERMQVLWLRLSSGSLLGDRTWVPADVVRSVGADAVIVDSNDAVRSSVDTHEAKDLRREGRRIVGTTVMTESGHKIGEANDYEFAPDTMAVTKVYLPPESGFNLLRKSEGGKSVTTDRIVTVGADVIVVRDNWETNVAPPPAQG